MQEVQKMVHQGSSAVTHTYISLTKMARMMQVSLLEGGEVPNLHELPGMIFREIVGETMPPLSKGRRKSEIYPVKKPRKTSPHVRFIREKNQRGEIFIGYGDFLEWLITKPAFNLLTVYLLGYGPGNEKFDNDVLPDGANAIFDKIHAARKGVLLSYTAADPKEPWKVHVEMPPVDMSEYVVEAEVKLLFDRMLKIKENHFQILSEFLLIASDSVLESSVPFQEAMAEKEAGLYHPSDFEEISELREEGWEVGAVSCKKTIDEEGEASYEFFWSRGQLLNFITGYFTILPRPNLASEFFGNRMIEDIESGELMHLLPDESSYSYKRKNVFPATVVW